MPDSVPFQFLSLKDCLAVAGIKKPTLKSDRHLGYSVAAFGLGKPLFDARCLLLDGYAMVIHNSLSKTVGRHTSASLVRVCWDLWAHALSRVEHVREPVLLAVAETKNGDWFMHAAHIDALPAMVRRLSPMRKFLTVNLALHMDEMRERAAKLGKELGWFTLLPDDPRWLEWMQEHRQWRKRGMARFEAERGNAPPRPSQATIDSIRAIAGETLH